MDSEQVVAAKAFIGFEDATQFAQRFRLYLAHTLSREVELSGDVLESVVDVIGQAEARVQYEALGGLELQ